MRSSRFVEDVARAKIVASADDAGLDGTPLARERRRAAVRSARPSRAGVSCSRCEDPGRRRA